MTDELKKKILLVDDDSFLLRMYSLKFEKSNYEVTAVLSSQDALNKLKDGLKPDVLIFDVVLPGMDGIDLLSAVRTQHLADQAKCLILSNQGEPSDIDRAKKIGIDGYVVKASSIPSEVVKAVDEILAKK
jgi:two-component system chemotaxis response regulator CheY